MSVELFVVAVAVVSNRLLCPVWESQRIVDECCLGRVRISGHTSVEEMAVEPEICIGLLRELKSLNNFRCTNLLSVVMSLLLHLRNVGRFADLNAHLPRPLKVTVRQFFLILKRAKV